MSSEMQRKWLVPPRGQAALVATAGVIIYTDR